MDRAELQAAVRALIEQADLSEPEFIPGKSTVNVCREYITNSDLAAAAEALLSGWLPEGERTLAFERAFAAYNGTATATTTVSGSSALLMAFAALRSPNLDGHLRAGDEVACVALTFPTSLNAILLNQLVPRFIDVAEDMNIDLDLLERSITPRTRALLVLHHLGNPVDMDRVRAIAEKHELFVVEDCCDAHGAEFSGKKVGSFGDAGCFSFYAAHGMTMGEGGAVTTSREELIPLLLAMKTCGLAFPHNPKAGRPAWLPAWEQRFAHIKDIDSRTLYSDIGYKFRILDLQGALGLEQLKKLPRFVEARRKNADWLTAHLSQHSQFLQLPIVHGKAKPSWYGYPIEVRDGPFSREQLTQFLESRHIETRPLLGGNLLKQPCYSGLNAPSTALPNTERFHHSGFYIASHPRLTQPMLEYIAQTFDEFFKKHK